MAVDLSPHEGLKFRRSNKGETLRVVKQAFAVMRPGKLLIHNHELVVQYAT